MILKIVAIIFVLTGIFLYIVVRASSRSVGEDMQKSLDEEQAKVVAELSNRTPEHEWDTKCRSVFANDIDTEGRAVFDPDKPTYDPKDKEHTEQYRIPVYDEKKLKAWEASHGRAFDLNTDRDQIKEVQACRVREGKGCEYKWQKVNIPSNDWNDRANAEIWRESWAKYCNEYLSPENHIDHRSYARQGIDLEPTIHEGITARKMESDGKVADRVQINREIAERNSLRKQIKQIAQELTAAITEKARDIYGQFREFIGSIGTAGADAERDRDADLGQTVTTASAERQRLGDTADDIREFINGLNAEERASEEKRDAALSEREDREIERKRQTADRSFEERAERDRALRQSKSRARISYGPQIAFFIGAWDIKECFSEDIAGISVAVTVEFVLAAILVTALYFLIRKLIIPCIKFYVEFYADQITVAESIFTLGILVWFADAMTWIPWNLVCVWFVLHGIYAGVRLLIMAISMQ